MKLRATTKKNVEEEIKEKLDRPACNEKRRCQVVCGISKKTGDLNLGEAKIFRKTFNFPKKSTFRT